MRTEQIVSWLENHPERASSALDALEALSGYAEENLAPAQLQAFTDLMNLLGLDASEPGVVLIASREVSA